MTCNWPPSSLLGKVTPCMLFTCDHNHQLSCMSMWVTPFCVCMSLSPTSDGKGDTSAFSPQRCLSITRTSLAKGKPPKASSISRTAELSTAGSTTTSTSLCSALSSETGPTTLLQALRRRWQAGSQPSVFTVVSPLQRVRSSQHCVRIMLCVVVVLCWSCHAFLL